MVGHLASGKDHKLDRRKKLKIFLRIKHSLTTINDLSLKLKFRCEMASKLNMWVKSNILGSSLFSLSEK